MGIPRFFKKIVQQYPDTTMSIKEVSQIDYFFIDFNAMIYNVYEVFRKEHKLVNMKEYETKLIIAVCDYVKEMVHTIDPKKQLYLALDGPVPRAKMVQQRWRRFKGVQEMSYLKELKDKYNIPIEPEWDKTKISPGTEFMVNLSVELHRCMKKKELCECEVILSDTQVAGEGEHKYMPLVRKLVGTDDTIAIFSPDADMIVLAALSNKSNVYILKTPDKKQDADLYNIYGEDKFFYLSIDTYKKYLIKDLGEEFNKKLDKTKLTMDFVFLTFLCGNDFVLPMQYLRISGNPREDGFTRTKTIYKHLLGEYEEFLVIEKSPNVKTGGKSTSKNNSASNSTSASNSNSASNNGKSPNYTINLNFFKKLLNDLAENEMHYLQMMKKNNDRNRKNPDKCKTKGYEDMTDFEKAKSNFEHAPYVCVNNPFHAKYNPLFYKVDPYKENWADAYYQLHFGLNTNKKDFNKQLDEICHNYLESIVFNLKYYVSGSPPSWQWFYRYNVPPTMTDFSKYVNSLKSLSSVKFTKGKPFKPFEQLMLILPPQSAQSILPKSLSISVNGPTTFDLNAVYGQKNIYSEPILPLVDADKVVEHVSKKMDKLTASEKKRNTTGRVKKVK